MSTINKKKLQKDWAYNKYWVMAKSPVIYQNIRLLFKNNDLTNEHMTQFYHYLQEADKLPINSCYLLVSYQHMWGYFKKIATPDEKEQYMDLQKKHENNPFLLLDFLQELTKKYQVSYLLQSRIIQKGL